MMGKKRDYTNRNKAKDINKYTQKIRNISGQKPDDIVKPQDY